MRCGSHRGTAAWQAHSSGRQRWIWRCGACARPVSVNEGEHAVSEVEAKRIIAMLVAAYPAWKPGERRPRCNSTERLLPPLSAGVAEQAVRQIIRTPREFAAPVGAICDQAARLALGRMGEAALSAEEAWAEVSAQIHRMGSYREIELPAAGADADCGSDGLERHLHQSQSGSDSCAFF
jgi:hypothetical protein